MMREQSVYKIYSRSRLKLFKPKIRLAKRKKYNFAYIVCVMLVAFVFYTVVWKSINPIFQNICQDEAKGIATKITNEESTEALENYNYDDLFTVQKDDTRKHKNDKF